MAQPAAQHPIHRDAADLLDAARYFTQVLLAQILNGETDLPPTDDDLVTLVECVEEAGRELAHARMVLWQAGLPSRSETLAARL